jgi:N-acetylglucosaminyl-diphospho-decaprenol L-rhamnosyltransferase
VSAVSLSVLIVTYNAGQDIETCLERLAESRIDRPYEVILVDNASTDGTPERVARVFPWVQVIAERTNHGFAGGNAVALKHARGAAILLLNPDAFLRDPGALSGLLDHLDAHPEVGAVGPRLTFPDGTHQVGDAGYEPRPLSILVHAAGLSGRFGLRGLYLASRQAKGARPLDVDWICGACLLLRRSAIAAIGGLQSPMFLYGEDVDWGCRLRDAGWRVAYRPDIAVTHLQGGSGSTRSARWLDGLAAIYSLRNAGRPLSSPAFFSGPLRLGFTLRALAYGLAARLRGQPDLARKADDMRRFAGHLRSLRL